MEAFLERLVLELVAIAVQVAVLHLVRWIGNRSPVNLGVVKPA